MRRPIIKTANPKSRVDVDDRRQDERQPSLATAVVWLGNRQFDARVVDESHGGLGVRVPPGTPVEAGLKVRIESNGLRQWATIRHVTERDDGYISLGLSWDY